MSLGLALKEVIANDRYSKLLKSFIIICRTLVGTVSAEIAPVCAIVGGFLAQDILKTLSGKDAPLLNYFLYNGIEGIDSHGLSFPFLGCSLKKCQLLTWDCNNTNLLCDSDRYWASSSCSEEERLSWPLFHYRCSCHSNPPNERWYLRGRQEHPTEFNCTSEGDTTIKL